MILPRVIKLLVNIFFDPFKTIIVNMEGVFGIALRRFYYRFSLGSMGKRVRIDPGVHIANPGHVHLGNRVWLDRGVQLIAGPPNIGTRHVKRLCKNADVPAGTLLIGDQCHIAPHVIIQAHGGVRIGSELTIAAGAKIYSFSHHYRDPDHPHDEIPYRFVGMVEGHLQLLLSGPVSIGDYAAVGMNAVMLPGSSLGDYAWLTVGSVLRGEIPEGAVASGVPAEIVKFRPGFPRVAHTVKNQ